MKIILQVDEIDLAKILASHTADYEGPDDYGTVERHWAAIDPHSQLEHVETAQRFIAAFDEDHSQRHAAGGIG